MGELVGLQLDNLVSRLITVYRQPNKPTTKVRQPFLNFTYLSMMQNMVIGLFFIDDKSGLPRIQTNKLYGGISYRKKVSCASFLPGQNKANRWYSSYTMLNCLKC